MDSLPKSSNLKKFVKNSERTAAGIKVSKPARKEVCLSWLPTIWWMTIVVWIKEVRITEYIVVIFQIQFVKLNLQN